jgi:hypothetical protein
MRIHAISAALLTTVLMASCSGFKEQKMIDMTQVAQFEDSLPTLVQGIRSIHTLQKDDPTEVTIILGDPSFYAAPDADKQKAAVRVGSMIMRVLGADNSITQGTLVISQKDKDLKEIPADGIKVDMKIADTKKAMYPGK